MMSAKDWLAVGAMLATLLCSPLVVRSIDRLYTRRNLQRFLKAVAALLGVSIVHMALSILPNYLFGEAALGKRLVELEADQELTEVVLSKVEEGKTSASTAMSARLRKLEDQAKRDRDAFFEEVREKLVKELSSPNMHGREGPVALRAEMQRKLDIESEQRRRIAAEMSHRLKELEKIQHETAAKVTRLQQRNEADIAEVRRALNRLLRQVKALLSQDLPATERR